jgi:hypothetical protein
MLGVADGGFLAENLEQRPIHSHRGAMAGLGSALPSPASSRA